MRQSARYLVQQASRRTLGRVRGRARAPECRIRSKSSRPPRVQVNDIVALAHRRCRRRFSSTATTAVRATGSFILIDEATNRTVAAGMLR